MVAHATKLNKYRGKEQGSLWFAFSPEHGWVVLDRSLAVNRFSDFPEDFIFTRCRDGEQFVQGESPWNYREAGRYLETLPLGQAAQAEQELNQWISAQAA